MSVAPAGPGAAPPRLAVEGVTKRYGARTVLDAIDLSVAEHEVVCVIGSSGCGKSTLLRGIDRLDPIDGGRIRLDGVDITARGVDANAVRRRIGIVFQSYSLFPHLRVIDNVTIGPRRAQRMPRTEAEDRALVVLDRLAVGWVLGCPPTRNPANRARGGFRAAGGVARRAGSAGTGGTRRTRPIWSRYRTRRGRIAEAAATASTTASTSTPRSWRTLVWMPRSTPRSAFTSYVSGFTFDTARTQPGMSATG